MVLPVPNVFIITDVSQSDSLALDTRCWSLRWERLSSGSEQRPSFFLPQEIRRAASQKGCSENSNERKRQVS